MSPRPAAGRVARAPVPHKALQLLLVSFGYFWLLLSTFGYFCVLLATFVYFWLLLAPFGHFWLLVRLLAAQLLDGSFEMDEGGHMEGVWGQLNPHSTPSPDSP